jgi:hypothetical protein
VSAFPHRCPTCGSPAYLGFRLVDCSNRHCPHAGKIAKRPMTTSRFICASTAHGGSPCLNEVLVTDGEGTCSTCGSDYSTDFAMNFPVLCP